MDEQIITLVVRLMEQFGALGGLAATVSISIIWGAKSLKTLVSNHLTHLQETQDKMLAELVKHNAISQRIKQRIEDVWQEIRNG